MIHYKKTGLLWQIFLRRV